MHNNDLFFLTSGNNVLDKVTLEELPDKIRFYKGKMKLVLEEINTENSRTRHQAYSICKVIEISKEKYEESLKIRQEYIKKSWDAYYKAMNLFSNCYAENKSIPSEVIAEKKKRLDSIPEIKSFLEIICELAEKY